MAPANTKLANHVRNEAQVVLLRSCVTCERTSTLDDLYGG